MLTGRTWPGLYDIFNNISWKGIDKIAAKKLLIYFFLNRDLLSPYPNYCRNPYIAAAIELQKKNKQNKRKTFATRTLSFLWWVVKIPLCL